MITWLSHLHEHFLARQPFVVASITAYNGSSPDSPGVALIYSTQQSHRCVSSDYRHQQLVNSAKALLETPTQYQTSTLRLGKVAGVENGSCEVFYEYFDGQHYPDWLTTLREKYREGIRCKLLREFDKADHTKAPRSAVLVEGHNKALSSVDTELIGNNTDCFTHEKDTTLSLLRAVHQSAIAVTLVGSHPIANEIEKQSTHLPITVKRVATLATRLDATASEASTVVIIMTSDHEADLLQCELALTLQTANSGFVGCIGSRKKADIFKSRLQHKGVTPGQLQQLHMPVGLPEINGKQPSVVAASIIAQILAQHQWQ